MWFGLLVRPSVFVAGPLNTQFGYEQPYHSRDYQVCFCRCMIADSIQKIGCSIDIHVVSLCQIETEKWNHNRL